jgi:nucleoside-diphosphate-sugar epimerase
VLRLLAPYVAAFVVGTSMRVSNTKAKAELGWKPTYSTYYEGVMATLSGVRVNTLAERIAPPALAKDNRA